MKNLLLYSFFILVSGKSDGQTQFGIYTEVRHNVFYYFHGGNGMYSESDLHLGGWVDVWKGNLSVYAIGRFGGYIHPFPNHSPDVLTPYVLCYSAFGAGLKYLFNTEKKISPFIRLEWLTEEPLKNRTGDFYINTNGLEPTNNSGGGIYPKYFSTNFIGNINAGIDWNVVRNFNINFGLGFGVRELKVRYEYTHSIQYYTNLLYGLNAQLGFSYSFPIRKNE